MYFLGPLAMSFVERFIIQCPYFGGSTMNRRFHCIALLKIVDFIKSYSRYCRIIHAHTHTLKDCIPCAYVPNDTLSIYITLTSQNKK